MKRCRGSSRRASRVAGDATAAPPRQQPMNISSGTRAPVTAYWYRYASPTKTLHGPYDHRTATGAPAIIPSGRQRVRLKPWGLLLPRRMRWGRRAPPIWAPDLRGLQPAQSQCRHSRQMGVAEVDTGRRARRQSGGGPAVLATRRAATAQCAGPALVGENQRGPCPPPAFPTTSGRRQRRPPPGRHCQGIAGKLGVPAKHGCWAYEPARLQGLQF